MKVKIFKIAKTKNPSLASNFINKTIIVGSLEFIQSIALLQRDLISFVSDPTEDASN